MDMYFSTWPKLLLYVPQARGCLLSWVRLRENGEKTQLKLFVEPTTAWCTCIFDWRKLRSSCGFCHGVTRPVSDFFDLSDAFGLQNQFSGLTFRESDPMQSPGARIDRPENSPSP